MILSRDRASWWQTSWLQVAALLAGLVTGWVAGPVLAQATAFDRGYQAAAAGDYATAWRLLGPLADAGDARAQYIIAWMYGEGLGIRRDFQAAVRWYETALLATATGKSARPAGHRQQPWRVHVGSYRTEVEARRWVDWLRQHFPADLASYPMQSVPYDHGGGLGRHVHLFITGVPGRERAAALCRALMARAVNCRVTP